MPKVYPVMKGSIGQRRIVKSIMSANFEIEKMHHLIVSSYWVVSLICKVFGISANFRKLKNVTCMDVDGMIIAQSYVVNY